MNKILCIEDDLDISDIFELALGDMYELKIITDTRNMMETLIAFMPDVILIDNYIGMIEAAEIVKEIRTSTMLSNIPFVLCSGHVNIKGIAAQISALAYLEKPFNLVDLYSVISQTISISKN
jgi:DNA-binding NtrC family response regulator